MAGHTQHNAIAEFKVPNELSFESEKTDIIAAEVLQEYVTILDKKVDGGTNNRINGIMKYNDALLVTSEIWYDASGTNKDNFQIFSDASNLAESDFKGMLQLDSAAQAAGYMSKIPADKVDELGGEYMVGWTTNYAIVSRYSQGPSIFTFDPEKAVEADIRVETSPKLLYPFEPGKELVDEGSIYKRDISPVWGPMSRAFYAFIIPGTDYFMAVGRHGGIHSGVGYKITQEDGYVCGGPCTYMSDDMYNYFWIFKVEDILNAEELWDAQPVSYGKWSHPYDEGGQKEVIGATFDEETSRLYISLRGAGQIEMYDRPPLILAYKILPR